MTDTFEKIIEDLKTPEGEARMRAYFAELDKKDKMHESQLERCRAKYTDEQLHNIILKIIEKYNSKKYQDRWYNRSIEPPEDLFFFLYDYAAKYGREATKKEYKIYSNMFSSGIYYIAGFYFNRMNGQGTVVKVMKPYFHVLSKKQLQRLIDEEKTWGDIMRDYAQPFWCKYTDALEGTMGCWTLTNLSKSNLNIEDKHCKSCDSYIKPYGE